MKPVVKKEMDKTTEEKIKLAAGKVFMEKGFAGARTRDIAQEAGINLALLNYYFRSKENLFEIVMLDKLKSFFDVIINIVIDTGSTYEEKLPKLVEKYTDLLMKEPNLPFFLLHELPQNPNFFDEKLHIKDKINLQSFAFFQSTLKLEKKEDALQLLITFLGMMIFPFIVRPAIQSLFDISEDDYTKILLDRKTLIPQWINETVKKRIE